MKMMLSIPSITSRAIRENKGINASVIFKLLWVKKRTFIYPAITVPAGWYYLIATKLEAFKIREETTDLNWKCEITPGLG